MIKEKLELRMFSHKFDYTIPENYYTCLLRLDACKTNDLTWKIGERFFKLRITRLEDKSLIHIYRNSYSTELLRVKAELLHEDENSTRFVGESLLSEGKFITLCAAFIIILFYVIHLWLFSLALA